MTHKKQQNKSKSSGPIAFRGDERAVSELLGAVLFFALLILLLVLAQVTLVPALNQQVEYEHSLRASDDFGDLQSSASRVAASGSPETVSLELGVTYPNRPLLINPAPVRGTVRTGETTDLTITNVRTINPETNQFWGASPLAGDYNTTPIRYEASYNEYRSAGTTVYENSVLYKRFETRNGVRNVATGEQAPLIEGDRITVVTVTGSLNENSQRAESVALAPVSAPSRSIAVRNVSATEPITITTGTSLTGDEWRELIGNESAVAPDGIDVTNGVLTVTLNPGTYQLRMARVGVGTDQGRATPEYLTREPEMNNVVPNNGGQVSVEVRDRYNNPVSGAEVTFVITDGPTANLTVGDDTVTQGQEITAISDENGLATVTAAGGDEDIEIRAFREMGGDPATIQNYEEVRFDVQVGSGDDDDNGGGGGGDPNDGGDINPNTPEGNLIYVNSTIPDTRSSTVTANFRNSRTGTGDITVTDLRVNFIGANGPGSSTGGAVNMFADTLTVDGQVRNSENIVGAGRFVEMTPDIVVTDGETEAFVFQFVNPGSNQDIFRDGDILVVSMLLDDDGDGAPDDRATYFLRIEKATNNGNQGGGNQGGGNN